MPKLLQNLKDRIAALPAGPRWLLGGTALLAAVLLGGAITAYGGLLLVALLWALCTGGLWLLLTTVWRVCFPGEALKKDRPFLISWAAGSVVGAAVIAALIFYRQTVYETDAINYYAKQSLLFGSFGTNGFYGVHTLLENLLFADYKMFINLFISVPYFFLPRTLEMFMLSYALTCFVPMWFAVLMAAKWLGAAWGPRPRLYYPLCMGLAVLWPMFLWPATHGMPDAFGLTFAAALALLTAGYRFESLQGQSARFIAVWAAALALILTRRWYMFWLLAYGVCYLAAVLPGAARRHCLGATVKNLFCFAVPAGLALAAPLAPTFYTALTTDYADIYGAYYGGGFLTNVQAQAGKQGWLFLLACAAGLALACARRQRRVPALVLLASGVGAMMLFTRVQSMGDHQSLILAPMYLGLAFCLLAAVCALPSAAAARVGAGAAVLFVLVNFGNALRLPDLNVKTPLLSNESLDLTRRGDLAAMRAVTDFVLADCAPEDTVYINIDSDGYSGTAFAYSDPAHPALQSMILWESSVPSTHGFPLGLWTARYVMVTDKFDESLVGRVNTALRTDTPAAAHYTYVTEFPLQNGIVLYCYARQGAPDAAEAGYYKGVFADYDARWPELFSARIDAYMAAQ